MDFIRETFPLAISRIALGESKDISWNFRDEAELVLSVKGSVRVIASDGFQAFTLREGEGVFIAPMTMNMIKSATEKSEIISLVFSPVLLWNDMDSPIYTRCIVPLMHSKDGLVSLSSQSARRIEEILSVVEEKQFGYELEARDLLSSIILLLIRERGDGSERGQGIRNDRLLRMVSFIKENYKEDIHLKDIAKAASVSEREALRTFQRSLSISPVQFLITHRLSEGAKLLEISQYNIEEIADMIGFDSPSHFSRLFKRSYSLSPTQYRRWFLQA